MSSSTSPGRSSDRVVICAWLIVPVEAESTEPTRFALRPIEMT